MAGELGKRAIAFVCRREHHGAGALGLFLEEIGGGFIANEGFDLETARATVAAGEADAVAFGKLFIANPDLPERFRRGAPLNAPMPETFYAHGAEGYVDYPFLAP